tara:strand:- start:343 stop:555 length:213 start_codon:yes stop_codon:yes gene_type:complete
VIKKGNTCFVLKDFMDQMIKKRAINGPNKCILKESSKSPCKAKQVDLVKKHVGHGTPVICLRGQEIPGKE